MWKLDLAFADVVATSTDPRLGAIRLAWWRERLEELDEGAVTPAEPRLQAVITELLPRGVSGKSLSGLEDAWLPLLDPFPWGKAVAEGLKLRGRILFGIGAQLLGGDPADAEAAGAFWSLADGAQHCTDKASSDMLTHEAKLSRRELRGKLPREVRPLTVLAAVAAADVHAGNGLARLVAAVRHRLFGTFPRS